MPTVRGGRRKGDIIIMKSPAPTAPQISDRAATRKMTLDMIIALVPAFIASIVIFGLRALLVTLVCVIIAVLAEFVFQKAMKKPVTVGDLSAIVTGMLLSFCLPVNIPLWIAGLGSIVAIIVVKQLFGGIGQNFANPAITARVILLISFGIEMTNFATDTVSHATPLASNANPGFMSLFLGTRGGCLGETCALALLIGGIYLIIRKTISWHIPVAYLATVAVLSLITGQDVLLQLMGGGLLLGAIFMAPDPTTSPRSGLCKIVYGVGCGLLTMMIRLLGATPEGVSYAILLMNILTPHIEKIGRRKAAGGDAA